MKRCDADPAGKQQHFWIGVILQSERSLDNGSPEPEQPNRLRSLASGLGRVYWWVNARRTLGKTGLELSPLGFGGGPIGYLKAEQKQVERVLSLLLDEGVNVVDTAACYDESEELIGTIVGSRRNDCVLVSKCGHQVPGIDAPEWSPGLIEQTVDRSLKRLRTDYLDVMLLHSCGLPVLKTGEAFSALMKARDAGKVRFIGYSGDNRAAVYASGIPQLDVIETSVNICDQANVSSVLPKARERQLGVIAKRPIANAAWKSAAEQPGMYAGYAAPYAERLQQMGLNPQDLGFDGDPSRAWPEIALRFTLSQPGVHTAITGTTNPDNARANLQAAALGPLPDSVVQKIQDAFQAAALKSKEGWPGLS